jgi:hypothetical protein
MPVVITIKGTFEGLDRSQIRDYVESVVTEAQGESPQRVIFHTAVGQSPEDKRQQLMALQQSDRS